MFASRVQKDVTIGENTVTIRKLSGRSLEKASEARQIAVAENMRRMGGDVLTSLRALQQDQPAKPPDYAAATKARYAQYDRTAVLLAGIVRWDAPEEVSLKTVEDLEEDFAQRAHEAILDLSLPPLDPAELKAQQSKDSGLSISS